MTFEERQGISLCMIVRDEEHCIEQVLSTSRPYVDQIVVVDTGSTDKTIQLAEPFVDVFEHFVWIDDFAAARNYSLEFATQPWILVLDADEVIDPADFDRLYKLTLRDDVDGYYLTQRLYLDNEDGAVAVWKPVDKPDTFSKGYRGYRENRILRLFRNHPSIRYSNQIHEIVDYTIEPDRIVDSGVSIHHYHEKTENDSIRHSQRDLAIQEMLIASGKASGREYLSAGANHLRVTHDYDKAIAYCSRALELGANAGAAMESCAEALYRAGRIAEAAALYEQLYRSQIGTSAVLNNLSNLRARLGDLGGAIALLEELIEQGIDDPVRKERIKSNAAALKRALESESAKQGRA